MARSTVSDTELLGRAGDVFRTYGYEGASLARLSAAIGLEKASLYHRFPGGKRQIALAVAQTIYAWFEAHIFVPLQQDEPAGDKIRRVAEQLRVFYVDGRRACAFDMLSFGEGGAELAAALTFALEAWLRAFAQCAREAGLPEAEAQIRAEAAIIRIEGALVLGRVLGDMRLFEESLETLPALLTNR